MGVREIEADKARPGIGRRTSEANRKPTIARVRDNLNCPTLKDEGYHVAEFRRFIKIELAF